MKKIIITMIAFVCLSSVALAQSPALFAPTTLKVESVPSGVYNPNYLQFIATVTWKYYQAGQPATYTSDLHGYYTEYTPHFPIYIPFYLPAWIDESQVISTSATITFNYGEGGATSTTFTGFADLIRCPADMLTWWFK